MWGNASIDQVLEKFESARCERNRTIGIKGGSPSRLMTGMMRLDFQADGTTARRRTRLKKESKR